MTSATVQSAKQPALHLTEQPPLRIVSQGGAQRSEQFQVSTDSRKILLAASDNRRLTQIPLPGSGELFVTRIEGVYNDTDLTVRPQNGRNGEQVRFPGFWWKSPPAARGRRLIFRPQSTTPNRIKARGGSVPRDFPWSRG